MSLKLMRMLDATMQGIENELFVLSKTKMLFGDAKDTLQKLVRELKES